MFAYRLKTFYSAAFKLFLFLFLVMFCWIYVDMYGIIVIFRGDYYAFKKNQNQ